MNYLDAIPTNILATLLATLITGLVGFLCIALTQYFNRQIESIKSNHAIQKIEHDAKVAYEFSAKKRLYETCAPYIFQAQIALNEVEDRVSGITSLSYDKLNKPQSDVLKEDYYIKNTLFRIFRVSSIVDYLRKTLLFQDFRLDYDIGYRVILLHVFDDMLSCYTDISKTNGAVFMRLVTEPENSQQGLTKGQCALLTELVGDANSKAPLSWGHFERILKAESISGSTLQALNSFDIMVSNFDFRRDWILWRIFIGYYVVAQFYREGKRIGFNEVESQFMRDVGRFLPDGTKLEFDNESKSDIQASYDYVNSRIEKTAKIFGFKEAGYNDGDK